MKGKSGPLSFWIFVTPIIILFLGTVIVPFISGIYYSFTDWKGLPGSETNWVGAENYFKIFSDTSFFNAMRATSIYLLYSVVLINIIGFLLALLVTRPLKGANLLRASFFIPNMIGGLLLGYIWKFIFLKIFPSMYDFTGLFFFNYPWLSETQLALAGMAIVSTWQMGGYIMIIYIAAIQAIPEEYYEAARIDGASAFQMMKNITLPLVAPAITISLFLTVSQGFKMFDVNVSLTNGDPARTTELLALNIYQTAFTNSEFSYAQSLSLMFMLLIAVVTLTQVYISKKRELEY